jgi:hypothetical protein
MASISDFPKLKKQKYGESADENSLLDMRMQIATTITSVEALKELTEEISQGKQGENILSADEQYSMATLDKTIKYLESMDEYLRKNLYDNTPSSIFEEALSYTKALFLERGTIPAMKSKNSTDPFVVVDFDAVLESTVRFARLAEPETFGTELQEVLDNHLSLQRQILTLDPSIYSTDMHEMNRGLIEIINNVTEITEDTIRGQRGMSSTEAKTLVKLLEKLNSLYPSKDLREDIDKIQKNTNLSAKQLLESLIKIITNAINSCNSYIKDKITAIQSTQISTKKTFLISDQVSKKSKETPEGFEDIPLDDEEINIPNKKGPKQ